MPQPPPKSLIFQFTLAHFSFHVCVGVLIPLLPVMRDSLNLNYFQSGVLVSCYSIAYGFGQIPFAMIADKLSSRVIIIMGLFGMSLTGIGVSFTSAYWQMIPFFIVMGLLAATYHAPAASYLSELFPSAKRGKALGFHNIGGSASFFLTPPMTLGVAYLFHTWRASFFILAFPALLVGILLWTTTRDPKGESRTLTEKAADAAGESAESDAAANTEKAKVSWIQVVQALGIIAFLSLTVRLFSAGVRSYLPLYMVDRHGISPQLAGLVISLIAGSGIIGSPLGGALSDRYGRKRVILFSLSLSGPLLLAVAKLPYGIPLLISMLLYGMTMSVRMPSMLSLIADVVPVGRRTTVLGVYFLIGEEVSGITTPIIGRLIDVYGIDPAFTGIAVGLCLLSAVALSFRKRL